MEQDTASALLGVEGLRVVDVEIEDDARVTVWVATDDPGAARCSGCGVLADRVHERVVTRPADVRRAADAVGLVWLKHRWKCGNEDCGRATFTEALADRAEQATVVVVPVERASDDEVDVLRGQLRRVHFPPTVELRGEQQTEELPRYAHIGSRTVARTRSSSSPR